MHTFFAGLLGFFIGITSFFHGGGGIPSSSHQPQPTQQAMNSGTPATPSGMMVGRFGRGRKETNLPAGEKPFFGTVITVNGSILTLQMQRGMRRFNSDSPSMTPPAPQTLTITLDSSTTYTGGTQSTITTNTRLAGIGKSNSDGSLTAVSVRINPTMPSGFSMRNRNPNSQDNH